MSASDNVFISRSRLDIAAMINAGQLIQWIEDDGTYTYVCYNLYPTAVRTDATWQVKRITNATGVGVFAVSGGMPTDRFVHQASNVTALTYNAL